MQEFQNEEYYNLLELQNLLNSFEKAYPIIKKNIEKFNITSEKDICYLAWIAGMNFKIDNDINFLQKFMQDILFKNIYKSLNVNKISQKALLFIYFSLGLITINNYSSNKKDFYKDYLHLISKGSILIDTLKFDRYEDGYKYWELSTIIKHIGKKGSNKNFTNETFYKDDILEEVSSRLIN